MSNRSEQPTIQCLVRYAGDEIPTVSVAAIADSFSITQRLRNRENGFTSIQHPGYSLDILFVDRLRLLVWSGLVVHSLEQIGRDTLRRCSSGLKTDRDPQLERGQTVNRFIGQTILPLTQL